MKYSAEFKVNNIGQVINIELFKLKKNQAWLAEKCNVTQATISMIINEKRKPSKKILYGISKALNIPYDELIKIGGENNDKDWR